MDKAHQNFLLTSSASDMEMALNAMSTIGSTSVSRNIVGHGHTWLVTFISMTYGGSLYGQLDVDATGLTGSNPSVLVKNSPPEQIVICSASSGDVNLDFMGDTVSLAFDSSAEDVEDAMKAMSNVHDVDVRFASGQTQLCDDTTTYETTIMLRWDISATPYYREHVAHFAPLSSNDVDVEVRQSNRNYAEVIGRLPHWYVIEGLVAGSSYFVRVSAHNAVGFGPYAVHDVNDVGHCHETICTLAVSMRTFPRPPAEPTNVNVTIRDSTSLDVTWNAPFTTGGNAISSYLVEWDVVDTFDSKCGETYEIQSVQVISDSAANIAGSFRFEIDGIDTTSTCLVWPPSEAEVESFFNEAPAGLTTSVVREGDENSGEWGFGYTYTITFQESGLNIGDLTIASCGVSSLSSIMGNMDTTIQTLQEGRGDPTNSCGASFLEPIGSVSVSTPVSFPVVVRDLTPGIPYFVRVSARNAYGFGPVTMANEKISTTPKAVPNVPRPASQSYGLQSSTSTSLRVDFTNPYNTKVEGNRGSSIDSYKIEWGRAISEVQKVVLNVSDAIDAGQFALAFSNDGDGVFEVTKCLNYDANAAEVAFALNALDTLDGVEVERFAESSYYVTFQGDVAQGLYGDVDMLEIREGSSAGCDDFVFSQGVTGYVSSNVETEVEGVKPFLPSVIEVRTSATSGEELRGHFHLSVDFQGDMTSRALPGTVSVSPGSNVVSSTSDLRPYLLRGDWIQIGDERFRVHDTAPFTSTQVPLDSYHRFGADTATAYGEDTRVGNAICEPSQRICYLTDDLTNWIDVGDTVMLDDLVVQVSTFDGWQLEWNTGSAVSSSSSSWGGSSEWPSAFGSSFVKLRIRKEVAISARASSQDVKHALETLPGVGSVDVTRAGPSDVGGFVWRITFTSGSVNTILADVKENGVGTTLLGVGAQVSITNIRDAIVPDDEDWQSASSVEIQDRVTELQSITISDESCVFDLTLEGPGGYDTTETQSISNLNAHTTAKDMKFLLEGLANIGIVDVSKSDLSWSVTFVSNQGDVPMVSSSSPCVQVDEARAGIETSSSYDIPNLQSGEMYYARVSASNEVGYGSDTTSEQLEGLGIAPLSHQVMTAPEAVTLSNVRALSGSQIKVEWSNTELNGDDVDGYLVEWWSQAPVLETQTVTLTNTHDDTLGYFVLTYGQGSNLERTTKLSWNSNAEDVQRALNNLKNLGHVLVEDTSMWNYTGSTYENVWTVTFQGDLGDVEMLGYESSLTGTSVLIDVQQTVQGSVHASSPSTSYGSYELSHRDFAREVDNRIGVDFEHGACSSSFDAVEQGVCSFGNAETFSIRTEGETEMSGHFTLWFRGEQTSPVSHDASSQELATALQALSTIQNEIKVWRSDKNLVSLGYEWRVTFAGDVGEVDALLVDGDYLVGADATIGVYRRVVVTNAAQRDDWHSSAEWRMEINGEITDAISHDATEIEVRTVLEDLNCVGSVVVSKEESKSFLPGTVNVESATNVIETASDLRSLLQGGDKVWIYRSDGPALEREVDTVSESTVQVTVAISENFVGTRLLRSANGYEYSLLFEVLDDSSNTLSRGLRTFRASPVPGSGSSMNWRASGSTLHTKLPFGVKPFTYVIGTKAEEQTLALYAESNLGSSGGEFYLTYNGVPTSCLDFDADSQDIENALNEIVHIDRVSVTSHGDGSATSEAPYGYVHDIVFWGEHEVPYEYVGCYDVDGTHISASSTEGSNPDLCAQDCKDEAYFALAGVDDSSQDCFCVGLSTALPGLSDFETFYESNSANSECGNTCGRWQCGSYDGIDLGDGGKVAVYAMRSVKKFGQTAVSQLQVGQDATRCTTALDSSASIHIHTRLDSNALTQYGHSYVALEENQEYFVRVTARNRAGYGVPSDAVSVITPLHGTAPGSPTALTVGRSYTSTSMDVFWNPPFDDGGRVITSYEVQWDDTSAFHTYESARVDLVPEVQVVEVKFGQSVNRGGTFKLMWSGRETIEMPWNVDASSMRAQLRVLTGFESLDANPIYVTRTTGSSNGYRWTVTFNMPLGNVEMLRFDDSKLEGYNPRMEASVLTEGRSDMTPGDFTLEIQSLSTSASNDITEGEIDLTFEGNTVTVPFDVSAFNMKDALQSLSTIHTVTVSRESIGEFQGTYLWKITFTHLAHEREQGAGDIGLLLASPNTLNPLASSGRFVNANVHVSENVKGTKAYRFNIEGLEPGTPYFVRVFARNGVDVGASSLVVQNYPRGQPSAPIDLSMSVISQTSLKAHWKEPVSNGGSEITAYEVEWYDRVPVNEVQILTLSANSHVTEIQSIETTSMENNMEGFFRLRFEGQTTDDISVTADENEVRDKLRRLSTIGDVTVTRDSSRFPLVGKIKIERDSSEILSTDNLNPSYSQDPSFPEIFILGERYCISAFGSSSDSDWPYTASLADCDTELSSTWSGESVQNVKAYKWAYGYVWTVSFTSHVGDVEQLQAIAGTLFSGTHASINVRTETEGLEPLSGTFKLSFEGSKTPSISFDETAGALENVLESLDTIGDVDVQRNDNGFGYMWRITFLSELGSIPLLIVSDDELTGPSASASVTRSVEGNHTAVGSSTVTDLTSAPNFELTLSDELIPGVSYFVRVQARNSEGLGFAAVIDSPEHPRTIPEMPSNLDLIVMGPSVLKIVWFAPTDAGMSDPEVPAISGGAFVDQYKIEWDTTSSFDNIATSGYSHVFSDVVATEENGHGYGPFYFNIPVSSSSQTYYVRVSAHNSAGFGEFAQADQGAQPHYVTPGDAQSVSVEVLNAYQLRVTFDAPSNELPEFGGDGGSNIDKYLVEWDIDFDALPHPSSAEFFDVSSGDQMEYIIGVRNITTGHVSTDLDENMLYSVRISAHNTMSGYGSLVTVTAPGVMENKSPSEILNVNAESDGSGSAMDVSWDLPLNDGGITLDSFKVQWSDAGGDDWSTASEIELYPVNERQVLLLESDNLNREVQHVDATVEVINEEQQIIFFVSGTDEVQSITTTSDVVIPEIQRIETSAIDVDEVQEIHVYANNVNEVQTITSTYDHVDEVQTIKIHADDVNEIQRVVVTNLAPGGSFVLHLNTSQPDGVDDDEDGCLLCAVQTYDFTSAIPWGSSGPDVKNALQQMDNVDLVSVSESYDATGDGIFTYDIEFSGSGVSGNVPTLWATFFNVDVTITTTQVGNELSGTFALYLDNSANYPSAHPGSDVIGSTDYISWNAVASIGDNTQDALHNSLSVHGEESVEYKLENALDGNNDAVYVESVFFLGGGGLFVSFVFLFIYPSISSHTHIYNRFGSVTVDRSSVHVDEAGGFTWTVTFHSLEGNVADLTCDTSQLTQSSPSGGNIECTVDEETRGNFAYGQFVLGLDGESTTFLDWDVSESEMKSAIQDAFNLGDVTVARSKVEETPSWSGGYEWQITFLVAPGDINAISVDETQMSPYVGSGPYLEVEETIQGNEIGGTFTLSFQGESTDPIDPNVVSDLDLASLLMGLSTIDDVEVQKQNYVGPARGVKWHVTFTHANQGGDVPMLVLEDSTSLTGLNAGVEMSEVVKGNELYGSFRVSYGGDTSGSISFDASESDVVDTLELMSTVGDVDVSKTLLDSEVQSYSWDITFRSEVHAGDGCAYMDSGEEWSSPHRPFSKCWGRNVGDIGEIGCVFDSLSDHHQSANCEVSTVQDGTDPVGGTFELVFDTTSCTTCAVQTVSTSDPISHMAHASHSTGGTASMEYILLQMDNLLGGTVEVTRSSVDVQTGGFTWYVDVPSRCILNKMYGSHRSHLSFCW